MDGTCSALPRVGYVYGGPGRFARRALLDRGQDALHLQAVPEGRGRVRARGDRGHQVPDLVSEGVLPAEYVTGRPPGRQVGVRRLGDQDGLEDRRVAVPVAELQLVQPLQVEGQAATLA